MFFTKCVKVVNLIKKCKKSRRQLCSSRDGNQTFSFILCCIKGSAQSNWGNVCALQTGISYNTVFNRKPNLYSRSPYYMNVNKKFNHGFETCVLLPVAPADVWCVSEGCLCASPAEWEAVILLLVRRVSLLPNETQEEVTEERLRPAESFEATSTL